MPIVTYCHFILYILLYYCIGNLPVSTIPSHMEASHWMSLESWMAVVAQHIYIYSYSAGESFICGISYHQTNTRPSKDIKQSVFSVPYSIFYHLLAERTIHHVAHTASCRSSVKIVVWCTSTSWSSYVTLTSRWSQVHKVYSAYFPNPNVDWSPRGQREHVTH